MRWGAVRAAVAPLPHCVSLAQGWASRAAAGVVAAMPPSRCPNRSPAAAEPRPGRRAARRSRPRPGRPPPAALAHVAHRQQAAVEKQHHAEHREQQPEGREAQADLCGRRGRRGRRGREASARRGAAVRSGARRPANGAPQEPRPPPSRAPCAARGLTPLVIEPAARDHGCCGPLPRARAGLWRAPAPRAPRRGPSMTIARRECRLQPMRFRAAALVARVLEGCCAGPLRRFCSWLGVVRRRKWLLWWAGCR
jgi:hypothetical protein